ncbi:MAG: GspH/FimT family pseudopilin [Verrucomicrobiae bacterium]|nr:GspH/FimT family pseudopilin [Verrucomicrobiae bacterium]MDW8344532.1 GspH/FimT family pseudopilin [Verrucomicrobiae bacterium]
MTSPTGSNPTRQPARRVNGLTTRGGFTLVELTIVMFVLATIMAVVVPYFVHYYHQARVDAAARELGTATQLARLHAITRQKTVWLEFDLDRQMYWLSRSSPDEALAEDALIAAFELPGTVRLAAVQTGDRPPRDAGQVATRFFPNGTCEEFWAMLRGTRSPRTITVWLDPVTARPAWID